MNMRVVCIDSAFWTYLTVSLSLFQMSSITSGPTGLVSSRFVGRAVSPRFTVTETHQGSVLTCSAIDSKGVSTNSTAQIDVFCKLQFPRCNVYTIAV